MPVYPSYDVETDSVIYHIVPSARSYRTESVSELTSEAETSLSGVTIQSDEVSEYFIEYHGRQQPANENAVRWFPSDNMKRYILRHVVEKHLFAGNYVGPEQGLGPGEIQEMADEFPHVQFRSLDMTPMIAHTPRSNIVFEVYDITEGLLLADNSQDIVFINVGAELVRDYRALLREVHRVLRPGGLLHIREQTPGYWDLHDHTQFARQTNPVGCRIVDFVRNAVKKFGVDLEMYDKIPLWLAPDSDMWKGCKSRAGFEGIHVVLRTFPSYPHANHPCSFKFDPQLVPLVAHYYIMCIRDSFGLLRDAGLGAEEANSLIEATIDEMKDPEKFSLFRIYIVYATKRS